MLARINFLFLFLSCVPFKFSFEPFILLCVQGWSDERFEFLIEFELASSTLSLSSISGYWYDQGSWSGKFSAVSLTSALISRRTRLVTLCWLILWRFCSKKPCLPMQIVFLSLKLYLDQTDFHSKMRTFVLVYLCLLLSNVCAYNWINLAARFQCCPVKTPKVLFWFRCIELLGFSPANVARDMEAFYLK